MRTTSKMNSILLSGVAPMVFLPVVYDNINLLELSGKLYTDLDVISRELVGHVPSVSIASDITRAAVGQSVSYSVSGPKTSIPIVPSMTIPEPRDTVRGTQQMMITRSEMVEFSWTGEERQAVMNGVGTGQLNNQDFGQAVRFLTNQIEQDLANEAIANASRATGTPGTTPYQSGVGDSAQLAKILKDNGAPMMSLSQVLDTTAGAQFQTNTQLTRANEIGDTMTVRDGEFGRLHKMSIKESGADVFVTSSGTVTTTDAAGYEVGATLINMAGAGHVPGDVISFAGDPEKYVVSLAVGTAVSIAKPGLRSAVPAAATAVTTADSYSANVAYAQSAMHLVTRAPAMPEGGDAAVDDMMIIDPRSGLAFEIRHYEGFHKSMTTIGIAWGVHASQSEHIALLLG